MDSVGMVRLPGGGNFAVSEQRKLTRRGPSSGFRRAGVPDLVGPGSCRGQGGRGLGRVGGRGPEPGVGDGVGGGRGLGRVWGRGPEPGGGGEVGGAEAWVGVGGGGGAGIRGGRSGLSPATEKGTLSPEKTLSPDFSPDFLSIFFSLRFLSVSQAFSQLRSHRFLHLEQVQPPLHPVTASVVRLYRGNEEKVATLGFVCKVKICCSATVEATEMKVAVAAAWS
ncbi:hypothetical protein TIFTF001_025720 [Ficus carica]|uniref:Uncharacterized protein n=1 Tax=Ficus carica TaxID=3494 RepID=A0AA88DEF8_FICCA|nr:hypothetical protein TIFTF001_025720 [Ficus carica]